MYSPLVFSAINPTLHSVTISSFHTFQPVPYCNGRIICHVCSHCSISTKWSQWKELSEWLGSSIRDAWLIEYMNFLVTVAHILIQSSPFIKNFSSGFHLRGWGSSPPPPPPPPLALQFNSPSPPPPPPIPKP